jgi:hypothetical protein
MKYATGKVRIQYTSAFDCLSSWQLLRVAGEIRHPACNFHQKSVCNRLKDSYNLADRAFIAARLAYPKAGTFENWAPASSRRGGFLPPGGS